MRELDADVVGESLGLLGLEKMRPVEKRRRGLEKGRNNFAFATEIDTPGSALAVRLGKTFQSARQMGCAFDA